MLFKELAFLGVVLMTEGRGRWFKSTQAHHKSPVFMRSFSLFPVPRLPLNKPFAKNLPKIRESLDQVSFDAPWPSAPLERCSRQAGIIEPLKRAGDHLNGLGIPFLVQARMNRYETLNVGL
jgi:hypothetical protein